MSRFVEVFKQMWVMNGDHLSRLYAGTGALGSGRSKVSTTALTCYIVHLEKSHTVDTVY